MHAQVVTALFTQEEGLGALAAFFHAYQCRMLLNIVLIRETSKVGHICLKATHKEADQGQASLTPGNPLHKSWYVSQGHITKTVDLVLCPEQGGKPTQHYIKGRTGDRQA